MGTHRAAQRPPPSPRPGPVRRAPPLPSGPSTAVRTRVPALPPAGRPRAHHRRVPRSSAGERTYLSAPTAANFPLLLSVPGGPETQGDGRLHPRHQPPSSPPGSAPHDPGQQEDGGGPGPRLSPGDPGLGAGRGRWRPRAGRDRRRDRERQRHQQREQQPTSHAHAAPAGGSCHSRGKIRGWNFPLSPRRFPGGR